MVLLPALGWMRARLGEDPTSPLEWMVKRGINLWEIITHLHHAEVERVG